MEQDAAPAAVSRTHRLGRPGVIVRPHYGGLPSMAGQVKANGGENRRDGREAAAQIVGQSSPLAGSTIPWTEKPRWSAARRARIVRWLHRQPAGRATDTRCASRRSVPLAQALACRECASPCLSRTRELLLVARMVSRRLTRRSLIGGAG